MKKLTALTTIIIILAACSSDNHWEEPVIPITLKGIEAVNIDNSGEFPVMTYSTVKKEAYMIGIKWIVDNTPDDVDDKFVTGPVKKGDRTHKSTVDYYSKAIKCNTQFNSDIPEGKYVSMYFKQADLNYLPADIDEALVLLVAPDPGKHSFTIEYYEGQELKFSYDTPLIEFF